MITAKGFEKNFSEAGFWAKLKKSARNLGQEAVEKALILLYALQDRQVPGWAKAVIVAALGYLISPIDAVPDFLPGGYVDDIGVMAAALGNIMTHVSEGTIARAKARAEQLFS